MKLGRVGFNTRGAPLTALSAIVGAILTILGGALVYHFWYILPHTMPINPQTSVRVVVGFFEVPSEVDTYRGLKKFEAFYVPPHVIQGDFLLPPLTWPDQVRVRLVYTTKDGEEKIIERYFTIACDPSGVYHPVGLVTEVQLFAYNDQGKEVFFGIPVPVQRPKVYRQYTPPTYPLSQPKLPTPPSARPDEKKPRFSQHVNG